jgi:hypothetical protein
MFLACSRTLDFASTIEDVPAVVDLKRTRGIFLDAAERCIIFEKRKKRKKKDGEWSSYMERKRERKGETRRTTEGCANTSQKKTEWKRKLLVNSSHVKGSCFTELRFTGGSTACCVDRYSFYLKSYRDKKVKTIGGSTNRANIIDGLHGSKAQHGPRAVRRIPSVD